MDARAERVERILDRTRSLFHRLNPSRNPSWLSVDLTMPQLKVLICVVEGDGATSGQIARGLGVTLPTITGIVDRLADQDLVTRREDPDDRRVTRVLPTAHGRTLVSDLLRYRTDMIRAVLSRLDVDQLRTVETAFDYLQGAADALATDLRFEEAVA